VRSDDTPHTGNLLPGFEPSEKDLVEIALAQPLEDKIRRSIGLLQMYEAGALRLSPDGYYLAFSGGKDSCVIKQLAIEAGVKFKAFYNLTTIDPPELVRFIKKHHAEVAWNKPEMPMMKYMVDNAKGVPTKMMRWCCEVYKEHGGGGLFRVVGVRVSESASRSLRWREFLQSPTHGLMLAPIAYWTDADVWEFIKSRNIPYCELYDQGFKRLGCIGCPLAGKSGQDREFARWPKYEAMWKRAVFKFYDRWHGIPNRKGEARYFEDFGSAQGLWDWWRSGKASEGEAQCFQEEMDMNI
jgi:phosphoadenosine phosphosulfate reductase